MAKVNFTKVEDMLNQGLQKISVGHLLNEADAAKGISKPSDAEVSSNRRLLTSIERGLKTLQSQDPEAYAKMGIKKKSLKKMIEAPEKLTPQEVETLKEIEEKIKKFKEELQETLPSLDNESIIESQRSKHINKRYNVNDKWLPLQ